MTTSDQLNRLNESLLALNQSRPLDFNIEDLDLPEQLECLIWFRDGGTISATEFTTGKNRVVHFILAKGRIRINLGAVSTPIASKKTKKRPGLILLLDEVASNILSEIKNRSSEKLRRSNESLLYIGCMVMNYSHDDFVVNAEKMNRFKLEYFGS